MLEAGAVKGARGRRRRAGAAAGRLAARGRGSAAGRALGRSAPSPTEQAVYGQAFDALKSRQLLGAITGSRTFCGTYPHSALADNAQYWLGEAYYVTQDYDTAIGAFRAVGEEMPASRKAPDALLKLGYTQCAEAVPGRCACDARVR